MKPIVLFALLFIFLFSLSCTIPPAQSSASALSQEENQHPTRRQLRGNLYEKKEILVVYGATDKSLQEKYQAFFTKLAQFQQKNSWMEIQLLHKNVTEITEEEIQNNILFLIGSSSANHLVQRLTINLPISFSNQAFSFDKKQYTSKNDIYSLFFYPNPEKKKFPFFLLTGNEEEVIYDFLNQKIQQNANFLRQNMDYEIYQNGLKSGMGNFNKSWELDQKVFFDFTKGNDTLFRSEHFDFISHQKEIGNGEIKELAESLESTFQSIQAFTKIKKEVPKFSYHIYPNSETKGLMTENTFQAHFDTTDQSVHTIISEQYASNFIEKENELLLNHLLGSPKTSILENGLAIHFTKQWQREGYAYWSARLAESKNALTLKELLDKDFMQDESPLIKDAMAASFVTFLMEDWGHQVFLKKYNNWIPNEQEIENLEKPWRKYLDNLVIQFPKKRKQSTKLPYLKGFNFAHEGYDIYNGYLSTMAITSLERQKALGSNAIAIVPYSYMRSDKSPSSIPIPQWAGGENDAGTIHSAYEAKRLGMVSLLKPQIWFGRSWPGAMEMQSEEDWQLFFKYYTRWIRHHAFLAEIHNIEMFCMGVEFAKATLTREKEWREMFRKIRGLYSGKMTYAANWGDEFEKVGFWDELDFIGLNSYYPLSKRDKPSNKELTSSFKKIKKKIEKVYNKFQKPIVFTEIGFRSINAPWKNPHAEGDDSFNEDHQAQCYKVVLKGIENEEWCNGILWWKFPTYIDYRGKENSSFTPNNKKAQEVVKEWFSK